MRCHLSSYPMVTNTERIFPFSVTHWASLSSWEQYNNKLRPVTPLHHHQCFHAFQSNIFINQLVRGVFFFLKNAAGCIAISHVHSLYQCLTACANRECWPAQTSQKTSFTSHLQNWGSHWEQKKSFRWDVKPLNGTIEVRFSWLEAGPS